MEGLREKDCAFCRREAAADALWESDRYRILPDAFPRCEGHVLLVTREHLPSHMHAPADWMPDFHAAQTRMRAFLTEHYGAAAFYENGGARQEVPHAHLHGLPYDPSVPAEWEQKGHVARIAGWEEARAAVEGEGHYFYLETSGGRYLIRKYGRVLKNVRGQLVAQTGARVDPLTGRMLRGGPEMVAATRAAWDDWTASTALPDQPGNVRLA